MEQRHQWQRTSRDIGSSSVSFKPRSRNVRFGDINRDGRSDIVWLDPTSGNFHAALSTTTSSGIGLGSDLCANNACPQSAIWGNDTNSLTGANLSDGTWQLLDFYGNGRSDLLTLQSNGSGAISVIRPSTEGFARMTNIRISILFLSAAATMALLPEWTHIYVADFDGDGLPDLLIAGDNGAESICSNPPGPRHNRMCFKDRTMSCSAHAKSPDLQRKACARRISMAMATPTSWPW